MLYPRDFFLYRKFKYLYIHKTSGCLLYIDKIKIMCWNVVYKEVYILDTILKLIWSDGFGWFRFYLNIPKNSMHNLYYEYLELISNQWNSMHGKKFMSFFGLDELELIYFFPCIQIVNYEYNFNSVKWIWSNQLCM